MHGVWGTLFACCMWSHYVVCLCCKLHAWAVWSSSAGYFKWMRWGSSHSLSDSKVQSNFTPGMSKYTKIWCVQVHLLSFSSCSGHTYSCSLIQQRNGVDQRPICTAQLYGQKPFFLFIRDVVIIFISGLSSLTVFPWSKDFCVWWFFFSLGHSWLHTLKLCTV